MARKRLLECSFLIPIRRDPNLSDGKLHKQKDWDWLAQELYEFEGATRARELYEGWYRDPHTGGPVTDLSRKYTVALPQRRVGELRILLRKACQVFHQKCIYLSIAGHVEFVEGPTHESS